MNEFLFGLIVCAGVALAMVVFPLAAKRHGFSKVTTVGFSVISIIPVVGIAYVELSPSPILAVIGGVVAFEVGLFLARRYLARVDRITGRETTA